MSVLSGPANLSPYSSDFLLPFLRIPSRFVLGWGSEDGATVLSDDIGAREFTINGTPAMGTASSLGIPFMSFDGSTDYLSAADAGWNSPTGGFTIIAIVSATAAAGMRIVSKEPGGTNRSFELTYHASIATSLQFIVSADGTSTLTSTTLTSGAPASGYNFIAARYTPSTSMVVWGNDNVVSNTTSIPASIFDSTGNINIGRRSAGTDYFTGNIYMLGLYGCVVATDHITTLINHAKKFGVA